MNKRIRLIIDSLVLLAVLASACAPAGALTPTSEHVTRPGTPVYEQLVWDCNTGKTLPADYSSDGPIQPDSGCDSWQINRYERPFNKETQDVFFPDLDILSGELGTDGTWFYFRMTIFDQNQADTKLTGTYAIELDLDLDGRGDVVALAHAPSEDATQDWTTQGVQFWGDINNDVGNDVPLAPDPPNTGNGYDTLVFDSGQGDDPDLAWVRVHPGKPAVLELAFKASAIYNDPRFKWLAWTDEGVDNRAGSDYHDTFDHPVAGDPIVGQAFFPSQSINELDNTCSVIWGAPQGTDLDLCINDPSVPPPTLQPSSTPTLDLTLPPSDHTPTPTQPDTTETATPVSETPCVPVGANNPFTCTPTATSTPTPTPSPTRITTTPCAPIVGAANIPNTCTPTPSPTPTRITTTPCAPIVGAANIPNTCTPTPTMTATQCYSYAAFAANNVVATCTPTPTRTYTPTPTGCPNPISSTAPRTTCTPTPTPCYGPITASVANNPIVTCTPTITPSPTECAVNFPFALIDCTPTPTLTPSATSTLCTQPAAATVLQQVPCTPTPTQCVAINFAALAVSPCTPTPTPTSCLVGTIIGYDNAGAPLYAYQECTPTLTPTPCNVTNTAGVVTPCTPTPATAAMMVYPDQDTNCRRAPNDQNIVDTLFKGVGYIPLGRTPDNLYLLMRGPASGQRCWAPSFLFTILFGPLSGVPGSVLPYILYPTATPTPTKAVPTAAPQCSDGVDNDGDGRIDYRAPTAGGVPGDAQCASPTDNSESS